MLGHGPEGVERIAIVAEGRRRRAKSGPRTEPVTDVAQMAQGARKVTLQHFALQIVAPTAANDLHEIVVMVAAAGEAANHRAVVAVGNRAIVTGGDYQIAIGAVEDIADGHAALLLSAQPADFEYQLAISVVKEAQLSIRRFAVVGVTEAAAAAHHAVC